MSIDRRNDSVKVVAAHIHDSLNAQKKLANHSEFQVISFTWKCSECLSFTEFVNSFIDFQNFQNDKKSFSPSYKIRSRGQISLLFVFDHQSPLRDPSGGSIFHFEQVCEIFFLLNYIFHIHHRKICENYIKTSIFIVDSLRNKISFWLRSGHPSKCLESVWNQLLPPFSFLSTSYLFWGFGILRDLASGREWEESGHFPRWVNIQDNLPSHNCLAITSIRQNFLLAAKRKSDVGIIQGLD